MKALRALVQRCASTVIGLLLLLAACLALLRAAPGGPFDQEKLVAPEVEAALAERYLLGAPFWRQYLHYLGHALRGDLGPSFQYPDFSVHELLAAAAPITLALGALAALLAMMLAVPLALAVAWRSPSRWDRLASISSLAALALPKFVLAPLLVLLFALALGWLPAAGFAWDAPLGWVLPILSLAIPQAALLARVLIENLHAALLSTPVLAASARGYPRRRVLLQHALPLATLQTIGLAGPLLIALLTGSAVVEQIFAIPGLGRYLVQAALNRDYPLLLGCVLLVALVVAVVNLLVEGLQAWLDPRVR